MKIRLFAFCTLLLSASLADAQEEKMLLSSTHDVVESESDAEYRAVKYVAADGKVRLVTYNMDGSPKSETFYSKFAKRHQNRVRDGKATLYYSTGEDSLVMNYVNDKRDGKDTIFYKSGNVKIVRKGDALTQYYESGKIKRSQTGNNGHCFDENGQEVEFTPFIVYPEYPGGGDALRHALNSTVAYPAEALKNKRQGKALVSFIVETDGSVRKHKLVGSTGSAELDIEAVRTTMVATSAKKWTPAIIDGEVVPFIYTVPVNFIWQ